MNIAQYITDACVVIVAIAGLVSHLSHKKAVQQVAQKVEDVAKQVEQHAPELANVATGLVQEVKPAEQPKA